MTDAAAEVEPGRTSAIAALRYRDFRLFWSGLLVSNTGTWMQMYGQGYLVVQLAFRDGVPHLAPLYLGLVGLARAVPAVSLGLFGGAIADRRDRRQLLIVMQLAASGVAATLAALTITERIDIVQVVLLAVLSSTVLAFEGPTRHALMPRLVRERDLVSAIGLSSAAFNGPQIVGPVIGGLLIVPFGVGGLFAVNALSYFAVVVALFRMTPTPVPPRAEGSLLRSVGDGLAYIRRDAVLSWLVVLTAGAALLARPYIQLLPAYAANVLRVGPLELSWLLAASGSGALAGGLVTASLGNVRRRGLLMLGTALVVGVALALLATQRSMWTALPLLAIVGVAVIVFVGMANTIMQTRASDRYRGRVMGVMSMLFMGGIPLGTMVLGSIGAAVGVEGAFATGGVGLIALALLGLIRAPALRGSLASSRHVRSSRALPPERNEH